MFLWHLIVHSPSSEPRQVALGAAAFFPGHPSHVDRESPVFVQGSPSPLVQPPYGRTSSSSSSARVISIDVKGPHHIARGSCATIGRGFGGLVGKHQPLSESAGTCTIDTPRSGLGPLRTGKMRHAANRIATAVANSQNGTTGFRTKPMATSAMKIKLRFPIIAWGLMASSPMDASGAQRGGKGHPMLGQGLRRSRAASLHRG
jgi:hypothetical protein